VNQAVSHSGNLAPRDARILLPDRIGDLLSGLAHHLNASDEGPLKGLVLEKGIPVNALTPAQQEPRFVEDVF
jgi:hypothetical protein